MLKMHTFEMKKTFYGHNEFAKAQNDLMGVGHSQYSHNENSQVYTYYVKKGIVILLFRCRYVKSSIMIKINPQKVLGEEPQENLFELNKNKFIECLTLVQKILEKNSIKLKEFIISRIDFTRDIKFEKSEIIDIYIKLLNKAGAPYRYVYKKYGNEVYKDSYEIINTNGLYSVAVYNKERESEQRNKRGASMRGVMRTEVRIMDIAALKEIFLAETLQFDKIIAMQEYAKVILENIFIDGFYIKLEKTKKILYEEYYSRKATKRQKNKIEKMIELSETIAIHRSAYDCIRGANALYAYDTIKDIKFQFEEKRINFISISANEHITVLPDLKYILGIKAESEMNKDNKFLADNSLTDKIPKYSIL